MALTASNMAALIKSYMDAVPPVQSSDSGALDAYRVALMEAMCQGIIDEIVANGVVTTTSGAPDGEHTGVIT